MRMALNALRGAQPGSRRAHGFKASWTAFLSSITMTQRETPGQHFAVLPIAPLFLEVISTRCRMEVGWTAAWAFWLVLRCCAALLRTFMASRLSRFVWLTGPTKRALVLAV